MGRPELDARYRWFVGLSEPESLDEVADLLVRGRGFILAHWGAEEISLHEDGERLELGDRAYTAILRESEGAPPERTDAIVERAVRAGSLSLLDLV